MYGLRRNPVIERLAQYPNWQNPNTRVTVEQSNYHDYPPPQYSNPYEDYLTVMSKCSEKIQLQIAQDERFKEIQAVCKSLIEQVLYPEIIPKVLQIPEGQRAFEELLACTQALKNHYTQEAVAEEQQKENQAQKIQEQEQQILALAGELKRMKGYVEEILAQKTEPPVSTVQLPTQPAPQAIQPIQRETLKVANKEESK